MHSTLVEVKGQLWMVVLTFHIASGAQSLSLFAMKSYTRGELALELLGDSHVPAVHLAVEVGRSEGQDCPELHSQFEDSLAYKRSGLRKRWGWSLLSKELRLSSFLLIFKVSTPSDSFQ